MLKSIGNNQSMSSGSLKVLHSFASVSMLDSNLGYVCLWFTHWTDSTVWRKCWYELVCIKFYIFVFYIIHKCPFNFFCSCCNINCLVKLLLNSCWNEVSSHMQSVNQWNLCQPTAFAVEVDALPLMGGHISWRSNQIWRLETMLCSFSMKEL